MLGPQPSQVHGGQANRCRSVSPLSRCVSAPLRSGSFTSGSNGCSSASTSGGHSIQARSSSRGRCQAGYHLPGRTSSSGGGASSSSNSRPPRSRTPPPLRAVAAPLDQQVLDPASNLDLVKVQFKCTFATSFGQELRIVGGAPELGAWDVTQAPAMTWSNGHVWMMNAFLPPGTYPFKLVVYTPGGRPESARWENGNNRSLTIEANSPELGNAALVLVDCSFDQTQHTSTQTKRITGIGFKATSLRGNPHASSSSSSSAGPADAHPSLPSAQAIANSDSSYRASMLAAAGIPTSKVTANAGAPTQQHQHAPYQQAPVAYQQQPPVAYQQPPPQQYVPPQPQQQVQQQFVQQQYVQQQYVQQQEPAAAAPSGTSAEHMPGTEAFNHRIANLDSRLAELLSRTGRQAPPAPAPAPPSPGHAPATAHSAPGMNNVVAAPAGAAVVLPPAAPAPAAAPAAAAAPPPAPAAAAGPRVSHQPPPEVQAAAAVCKEDPAAADACRVVTKFIQEHLEMIESQALEMMMHNDRLEKRMAALEQHTQDYDDNIMQALADSLVLTPDEDLQQLPDPGPVLNPAPAPAPAPAAAAAVKPAAPAAAAASSSSRAVPKAPAQAAAAAPAAAPAAGSPGSPSSDASELVRNFMASFGSGSMLAAGQRRASAEPLAPAEGTVPVMVGDDYVIDITASQEELMTELLLEHEQQQQEEAMAAAAAAAAAAQQQQTHADLAASQAVEQLLQQQQQGEQELQVPGNGSSAEAFAAALDAATPAFPSLSSDPYSLGIGAAAAGGNSSTLSQGPVPYNNPDPNWQAAHARALQWASNLVEPDSEEDEDEEEEVPWWLKDNLPAARKTPMPIGSSSSLSSPPSSPTNSSRLRWSRARFTAPGYEQQDDEEEGAEGEEGSSTGRSLRRPTAAQAAFSGSAVTLATATPATAAAAAAAAAASPLVQNLQQHAYKAAKAIGQSDQAAAIAATAIASRVAFGCDPEAAAASISSPRRRRRRGSASGGSSTGGGSGSSDGGGGGIAGAMAAAIKTRQQVLAVTDVAAALAVAGDRTGTTGPPELGSAAVQGSLDAAGFDPRPESLVPTVAAGPFQLADDVLVLPSAQQIATAAGPAPFLQHPQQHGEAGGPLAPVREEEEGGTGDEEDPSDAELLQLAALQQENLMLSELASLHTRVIGLHEQAMKLEKEAHADMEHAMADTSASTASMDFDSEDEDSAGEGDELGGVLGLALKTAQRQNGSRQKHDASAVKKLMAAVQLRMEAALLQKEASEKRRALNAMRSAAAAASAATFDRHWQVGEAAQQLQQQQQQQQGEEENSEDDDSDDADGGSSSDGGGGSGYGSSLELGMPASVAAASSAAATMAAATAAAPAPAPAVPSAAAAAWGTLEVQPVAAAAFTAAAPAAPAAAPAATEQPPAAEPQMLQRVRPMVPTSAVAGVMSQDEEWQHRAPQQAQHGSGSRGMQGAAAPAPAAAPVVVTALESSSWPGGAAGVPADMQEDMEAMRSKIAELRQKVSSRKNQIAALMGGASPDAVVALGAASGGAMALPAASLAVEGTGSAASILGAAAAAAAATAVAAAVPTVLAPPETPTVVEKAAQQAGAGAGPAAHLEGRSATNRADTSLKAAAVSALGGAAATAAGAAAVPSSPRGARFASRVLKSPSLVSSNSTDSYQSIYADEQQADSSAKVGRQDRLAQLQARTAAAVAAREQLSQQALEAQQALARISSSRQAAAAAAAAVGAAAGAVVAAKSARAAPAAAGAGSEPSPSDSSRAEALSQRASQAAKAVEALDHWEAQAATAKQSLEDLEQQAAAALAELQQHEATRQSGSLLRQQLMMRHKADNGWQQAIMAPVSSLGCAGPAAASPAVAGGGMAMQGVAGGVQGVCSRVPDPAAAAVITGLAAVTAVQAAGHILHDAWRL